MDILRKAALLKLKTRYMKKRKEYDEKIKKIDEELKEPLKPERLTGGYHR